jgi:hypothetical protein
MPWAAMPRCEWSFAIVSMFVVSAASIASPFMPVSGARPQPSCTLHQYERCVGMVDESGMHEADFVLDFDHGDREEEEEEDSVASH